ncbi:MAG: hypothetical protein PF904_17060 [Kiritimatiellae bacterium]|jgi:hypothetical protein|nr:hypothetical protein [Kiritimatiellia bacterium]
MDYEHKLQYLYSSLGDLQSTIRAVDAKVSYLLVILFVPLTKLSAIYAKLTQMFTSGALWLAIVAGILAFLFTLAWLVGFWCALRTIIAIEDPKQHIDGDRPDSMFYPAGLFSHKFWDIMGATKTRSVIQFSKHYSCIPENADEIAKHLTLEQMKAMYIASIKIKRSVFAYHAAILWVILGGVLWFLHLIFI